MQRKPSQGSRVDLSASDDDDKIFERPEHWKSEYQVLLSSWPCWLKALVVVHLTVGAIGLSFGISGLFHSSAEVESGTVSTTAVSSANILSERAIDMPVFESLSSEIETVTLRSGLTMPALGYGTCCRPSARGQAIVESTTRYLKAGGKLVDTAMAYGNHKEIGKALAASGVSRSDVWLTSKIAPNAVKSRNQTIAACGEILNDLGTNYLDLLLIHSPKLKQAKTIELWKGLVDLKATRKVRAIGVSNFNWVEIQALESATGKLPEVNQLQFHPWMPKEWKAVVAKQMENGVATTAYTSLGGSRFRKAGSKWGDAVATVARKHNATEAQLLLRWALQHGVAVIPGATSEAHIRENLGVPRFVLDPEDLLAIEQAPAPPSWFDPGRGPSKYDGQFAEVAWHT